MKKETLLVLKIGGNIIDNEALLKDTLDNFCKHKGKKILIHGGGKIANTISKQIGIEPKLMNGRRITHKEDLDIILMTYAGLINKKIVCHLQKAHNKCLGLTGVDLDLVRSEKRKIDTIDFGYVGDIKKVNTKELINLLKNNTLPIIAPITHNNNTLLNTNADTIATEIAIALNKKYHTTLFLSFNGDGIMHNNTLIEEIDKETACALLNNKIIHTGMIPKIGNALKSKSKGLHKVLIGNYNSFIKHNIATKIS